MRRWSTSARRNSQNESRASAREPSADKQTPADESREAFLCCGCLSGPHLQTPRADSPEIYEDKSFRGGISKFIGPAVVIGDARTARRGDFTMTKPVGGRGGARPPVCALYCAPPWSIVISESWLVKLAMNGADGPRGRILDFSTMQPRRANGKAERRNRASIQRASKAFSRDARLKNLCSSFCPNWLDDFCNSLVCRNLCLWSDCCWKKSRICPMDYYVIP